MRTLETSLAVVALVGAVACDATSPPAAAPGAGRVAIAVAPLALSGIVDADYTLTVTNAAAGAGEVVWTRALSSGDYGDGAGSLAYVGPCDGQTGVNTVRLDLDALYDAAGLVPTTSYLNPTPILREVSCAEGADAPVTFDMTIARRAQQGFFDVAVSFRDLFCSAKLDCLRAPGADLELLYNPLTQARDLTAVLGFACTGAPSGATWLYLNDPVITCAGAGFAAPTVVDASGTGNVALGTAPNANPHGYLFAAAVYRGRAGLQSVAYWNLSFGLNDQVFAAAGACTLSARATASATPFAPEALGFPLPAGSVYPVIDWSVPLTDASGRVCTQHQVDVVGSHVATAYPGQLSQAPVLLRHRYAPATGELLSATGSACTHGTTTFVATGAAQSFTVPSGCTTVAVKLWGAGGGGSTGAAYLYKLAGGGGGFSAGTAAATSGEVLTVIVGEGGGGSDHTSFTPFGGGTVAGGAYGSGGGGGRSALQRADGTELITAGGGGGGGYGNNLPYASAGGGLTGWATAILSYDGRPGTQTEGGAAGTGSFGVASAGSARQGGAGGVYCGGGGGGYFGGGGARGATGVQAGSGGGGSGYLGGVSGGQTVAGSNGSPANAADPSYVAGVGVGGDPGPGSGYLSGSDGGDGLVVVSW